MPMARYASGEVCALSYFLLLGWNICCTSQSFPIRQATKVKNLSMLQLLNQPFVSYCQKMDTTS